MVTKTLLYPEHYFAYAGVGSRNTPPDILNLMSQFAEKVADRATLRSGAAGGADSAFEKGVDVVGETRHIKKEIYIPAQGFQGRYTTEVGVQLCTNIIKLILKNMVAQYHPRGNRLSHYTMELMMRNCLQVLGATLNSHSRYVICWTDTYKTDSKDLICDGSGGTGMAIRIAYGHNIPVINLRSPEHFNLITKFLSEN